MSFNFNFNSQDMCASVIPSTRPTVTPVAITIFHLKVLLFCEILKRRTDRRTNGRTDTKYENSDHCPAVTMGRPRGSIILFLMLQIVNQVTKTVAECQSKSNFFDP